MDDLDIEAYRPTDNDGNLIKFYNLIWRMVPLFRQDEATEAQVAGFTVLIKSDSILLETSTLHIPELRAAVEKEPPLPDMSKQMHELLTRILDYDPLQPPESPMTNPIEWETKKTWAEKMSRDMITYLRPMDAVTDQMRLTALNVVHELEYMAQGSGPAPPMSTWNLASYGVGNPPGPFGAVLPKAPVKSGMNAILHLTPAASGSLQGNGALHHPPKVTTVPSEPDSTVGEPHSNKTGLDSPSSSGDKFSGTGRLSLPRLPAVSSSAIGTAFDANPNIDPNSRYADPTYNQTGVINFGNTCYRNATTWALVFTPGFVAMIESSDTVHPTMKDLISTLSLRLELLKQETCDVTSKLLVENKEACVKSLERVETQLLFWAVNSDPDDNNPNRAERCQIFRAGNIVQQDAAEWIDFLSKYVIPDLGDIFPVFNVHRLYRCTSCGREFETASLNEMVRLPAWKTEGFGKAPDRLEDLISLEFAQYRKLSDYRCESCAMTGVVEVKEEIEDHPPENIIVQFLRFEGTWDCRKKFTGRISYPKGPFAIKVRGGQLVWYQINVVICHRGKGSNSGHYYALVRRSQKESSQWTRWDDSQRWDIPLEEVDTEDAMLLLLRACSDPSNSSTKQSEAATSPEDGEEATTFDNDQNTIIIDTDHASISEVEVDSAATAAVPEQDEAVAKILVKLGTSYKEPIVVDAEDRKGDVTTPTVATTPEQREQQEAAAELLLGLHLSIGTPTMANTQSPPTGGATSTPKPSFTGEGSTYRALTRQSLQASLVSGLAPAKTHYTRGVRLSKQTRPPSDQGGGADGKSAANAVPDVTGLGPNDRCFDCAICSHTRHVRHRKEPANCDFESCVYEDNNGKEIGSIWEQYMYCRSCKTEKLTTEFSYRTQGNGGARYILWQCLDCNPEGYLVPGDEDIESNSGRYTREGVFIPVSQLTHSTSPRSSLPPGSLNLPSPDLSTSHILPPSPSPGPSLPPWLAPPFSFVGEAVRAQSTGILSGPALARVWRGPLMGTFTTQYPSQSSTDPDSQATPSSFTTNITDFDDTTDIDADEDKHID